MLENYIPGQPVWLPCQFCGTPVRLEGRYVGMAIRAGQKTSECQDCQRERMSPPLQAQTDFWKEIHRHNREQADQI